MNWNPGRRRVRLGLMLLVAVVIVGACWFWLVEGFEPVDALYQTLMTVTTVGFGEIEPLGTRGRLFASVLMIVGVGVALYAIVGLIEDVLEHQLGRWGRRRMEHQIEHLCDHVILCGYGRVGRGIVPLLTGRSTVVVVDRDEANVVEAQDADLMALVGDATDDDVLRAAGIERAATLVVSLQSDADAISTVLSARVLNPRLRIVARANAAHSEAKLVRAGVDHVVNPLRLGADRLATFALQPAVADFVDLVGPSAGEAFRLEQVVVPEVSPLAGRTMGECGIREATGALVLALREPGGDFESNPGPETVLRGGATLVVIGTPEQLAALDGHLRTGGSGPRPARPVPAAPAPGGSDRPPT